MQTDRIDRARARAPLAPVALGLIGGLGLALGQPQAATIVALPLLVVSARPRFRSACLAALLGLLLGAAARVGHASTARPLPLPGCYRIEGTLRWVQAGAAPAWQAVVDVDHLGDPEARWRVSLRARLVLWRSHAVPGARPGDRVRCIATLVRPDRARGRRSLMDARVPDVRAVEILGQPAPGSLEVLRARAAGLLATYMTAQDAGLAGAVLLGDRSRLTRSDRDTFRAAGQAHLLAVSGIHVGLLIAGVIWLLRRLGTPVRATWILGLAVAVLYVPFTGAPASAVRAGIGAAIYFGGRLLDRPPWPTAVLALVATGVLLARPMAIEDVSFQLSFSAVASICALAPRLRALWVAERPVVPGLLPPKRAPLRTALAVALAAWLGTAPLIAHYIGRLCPAGALLSLPALPLMALALGCGFGVLVFAPVPGAAGIFASGFEVAMSILRGLLDRAVDVGLGSQPAAAPTLPWWCLYLVAMGLLARRGKRAGWLALLGLAGLVFLLIADPDRSTVATAREYHARAQPMPHPIATHMLAEPGGLAALLGGLLVFALLTVRPLRWLTAGGAVGAWVLGACAGWRFGWAGLAAVFAPFTIATLLSKLPGPGRSGARTLRQVASNGLPALIGCGLAMLGEPEVGAAWFLGALACLGADTCATEIGVRYGGKPFRIAGRGSIAQGESGGVTWLGLLASAGGALLAPLAYGLVVGGSLGHVAALAAAGFGGALIDSALGATLQYRGRDPTTGQETEKRHLGGTPTAHASGLRLLDNDAVNLVSGVAAGAIAVGLTGLL